MHKITKEFRDRVESYRINLLRYNAPDVITVTFCESGHEASLIDSHIFDDRDLTSFELRILLRIWDSDYEFADLCQWDDEPKDRHPELLDHEKVEKTLLSLEQRGYISLN